MCHRLSSLCLISFSMLPLPPVSTLFPYTTLFRSHQTLQATTIALGRAPNRCIPDPWGSVRRQPDRKSTRLNSSHITISYAVFCLKKKMPKRDPTVHDLHGGGTGKADNREDGTGTV